MCHESREVLEALEISNTDVRVIAANLTAAELLSPNPVDKVVQSFGLKHLTRRDN